MSRARLLLAAGLFLVAAGCKEKKQEAPPSAAPTARPAPATGAPAAAVPALADALADAPARSAPAAEPGPAWFAVDKIGLVKLEGGTFKRVLSAPASIKQIVFGANSELWLNSFRGIYRYRDGKAIKVGGFRDAGNVRAMAVAPDGTLWTAGYRGVAHYDGKAWTREAKSLLGPDVKLLYGIKVDSLGRVWVVSANGLHVREKGRWRRVETGLTGKVFYKDLTMGPRGMLYALHSRAVLRSRGGTWNEMLLGQRVYSASRVAVGRPGEAHVWGSRKLYRARLGSPPTRIPGSRIGFRGSSVDAFTADRSGRTWLATSDGVFIVDDQGRSTRWAPGTVLDLAGKIRSIAVQGKGPSLPAVGPVQTGSVVGKLIREGVALGNVPIEICASPRMFFRKSPCNAAAFKQRRRTGADGTFRFSRVPIGTYRFAIKAGPKWTLTMSPCCSGMKVGQAYDIGALKLRAPKGKR